MTSYIATQGMLQVSASVADASMAREKIAQCSIAPDDNIAPRENNIVPWTIIPSLGMIILPRGQYYYPIGREYRPTGQ